MSQWLFNVNVDGVVREVNAIRCFRNGWNCMLYVVVYTLRVYVVICTGVI